jgi:hypothetical protein
LRIGEEQYSDLMLFLITKKTKVPNKLNLILID